MKFRLGITSVSRELRLAILVAILIAAGAVCVAYGWHASGIALLVIGVVTAAAVYMFVIRPARLPKDAALMIRIADGLREDAPRSPLEQLRNRGMPTLFHIRIALEAAASDPALKTVIVDLLAPGVGLATAQEIHDLLRAVVAAGKRVVAVLSGDNVSIRDYLIASGAGEIVVNPDSPVMMLGLSAGSLFARDALGKAGIEAQTLQWKEYKGAAETFTRDGMSPQLRESLEAIIADWKAAIADKIASARNLPIDVVRNLIGAGFMSARAASEAHLVDRLGYVDDLRAELEPDDKTRRIVSLGRYLRHVFQMRGGRKGERIALIHGLGPVVTGDGPAAGEFLSGERISEEIRRAARDKSIRAIVFRVNSPGGSAVGSDLVWRAVREAQRRKKPVVVSMGDVAGSGGYYVAMAADAIVAEPTTITGSIGVVYTKFSITDLMRTLGLNIDVAKSDSISDALSLARPMSESELAQLNQVVGELYSTFTAKVAEGRKLDPATAEEVARGRVWSGMAAKALRLVDDLGGLGRAVALAREKAGMKPDEPHDLVIYPQPNILSALNLTFSRADTGWPFEIAARVLGVPSRWAPAFIDLLARSGITLICPLIG